VFGSDDLEEGGEGSEIMPRPGMVGTRRCCSTRKRAPLSALAFELPLDMPAATGDCREIRAAAHP
jgi:hypothetical protein